MLIQTVTFKSELSEAETRRVMDDRMPQFRALPGLVQKYYARLPESGEYAGIYVWDSEESMREFRESDLAKSIPTVYKVTGPPRIENYEVIQPLRE